MDRIEARLSELGLTLPEARPPAGNYVPVRRTGNLVYTAGQIPSAAGREIKGKLGESLSVEEGQEAARLCVLNALAAIRSVVDSLESIRQIVRVGGFVNSAPGFTQQPLVINGASDLLVAVFGDAGRHARTAVGVNELPLGFACEVELIAEVS